MSLMIIRDVGELKIDFSRKLFCPGCHNNFILFLFSLLLLLILIFLMLLLLLLILMFQREIFSGQNYTLVEQRREFLILLSNFDKNIKTAITII